MVPRLSSIILRFKLQLYSTGQFQVWALFCPSSILIKILRFHEPFSAWAFDTWVRFYFILTCISLNIVTFSHSSPPALWGGVYLIILNSIHWVKYWKNHLSLSSLGVTPLISLLWSLSFSVASYRDSATINRGLVEASNTQYSQAITVVYSHLIDIKS